MKRFSTLLAAALLSVSLGTWTGAAQAAGAGKGAAKQRGGKAAEHRSEKGTLNTNGQWSADPERGWVRAEERHKMRDERDSGANREKQNNGKSKGKGKAKKS
jgi:hypothetical protein